MGSYKANRNEESLEEEERPKTQEEINNENNANTIKNAAEVAIASKNPYAMAAGYAVKGIDKVTGGKASQELGKVMTKANKNSPGGQQIQNLSNNLAESGVGDKIGQAASMKNGQSGGGKGGAPASGGKAPQGNTSSPSTGKSGGLKMGGSSNSTSSSSSSNSSSSSSSFLSDNMFSGMMGNKMKIYVVCIASVLLLFMMSFVAFAQKDQQNLALTNETVLASSSAGSRKCTSEQIAQKAVYVGDSRFVGMQSAVGESEATYIAKVAEGLSWFNSTALPEIEAKLAEDETAVVILGLGVNDLYNIDNYITAYNELIAKYPKANYFILSINPVDELKAQNNGYSTTNADIEAFNQKMQAAFPDKYVDTYSALKSDFETTDGLHYDDTTYNNVNSLILSKISTGYNVICSVGSISSIDAASLSGGGGKILSPGQSLLSLLGQAKIDEWTASIKSDVQAAGIGSGGAPAMAAYGLVQGALNEGIVIPYFWGGGHGVIADGINGSWGSAQTIGVGGSSAQPKGSTQASGMDCSGFVSWALKNGGCSSFTPILANDFQSLGPGIDPSQAVTGDIASSSSHVMIILNNTGTSLVIAEAKGSSYGIIFEEYSYSHFGKYKIVSMGDYYAKNCNG